MADYTLVERAKRHPTKNFYFSDRKFTKQEIELALAWCMGEVTITGVGDALKMQNTSVYLYLAQILREYVRRQHKTNK